MKRAQVVCSDQTLTMPSLMPASRTRAVRRSVRSSSSRRSSVSTTSNSPRTTIVPTAALVPSDSGVSREVIVELLLIDPSDMKQPSTAA
jgi:hypothetical protein